MKITAKPNVRQVIAAVLALLCIPLLFLPFESVHGKARESVISDQAKIDEYRSYEKNDFIIRTLAWKEGVSESEIRDFFTMLFRDSLPDPSLSDLREGFTAEARLMDSDLMGHVIRVDGNLAYYLSPETASEHLVFAVILNVLFFGTILVSLAAAVLYLLHRPKTGGVVLTVFAFLYLAEALHLDVYTHEKMLPGVSAFLFPFFAVLSLILCVARKPRPAPGAAEPAPAAEPGPVPEGVCPDCGAKLDERLPFCPNCGKMRE